MTKKPDVFVDYWKTKEGNWSIEIFDKDGSTLRRATCPGSKEEARQLAIEVLADVSAHMESVKNDQDE